MSEESELLKEYCTSLGLNQKESLDWEDINMLKTELLDAGEFGLANFLKSLSTPDELMDYVGEEE